MSGDKANRKMIRLPGFAGVEDRWRQTETTLRELALAIAEIVDASRENGTPVPRRQLQAEIKAAQKLFQQRVELIGEPLGYVAAVLVLDALITQAKWCGSDYHRQLLTIERSKGAS